MFSKTSQNSQKKTALESPFNPWSANPTKLWNTLKQFVGIFQRIVWVCLSILYVWHIRVNVEPAILLEKRLWHIFFSVNFENFFKNIFFIKHRLETASERRVLRKLANVHFYYKDISWNLQFFQGVDVGREGEFCKSHFIKGNIALTRNFLYIT